MKALRDRLYRIVCVSLAVAFMSLGCSAMSSPASVDEYERRSNGLGSDMMAPGYLNMDKQKAELIEEQAIPKKGLMEQVMDYISGKLRERVTENPTEQVTVPLKNKKAEESESSTIQTIDPAWGLADANGDNRVDLTDFAIVRGAFGTSVGDAGYNANADFDKDGTVGGSDLDIFEANFGIRYSNTPTVITTEILGDDPEYPIEKPKGLDLTDRRDVYGRSPYNPFERFTKGKNKVAVPEGEEEENVFTQTAEEVDMPDMRQNMKEEYDLSVPLEDPSSQEMRVPTMLEGIIMDPTIEQQEMIDISKSLMAVVENIEKETDNEELKKASEDFTKMVNSVMLAQAIPDLLKAGEMSSINGIFGELSTEKKNILFEYHASVEEYYKSVIKELASNITTLQASYILPKDLTQKEVEKLSAQRIDEIINKIRSVKDKTITEEQILKVEAKYREEYLVPAKRILEENIKTLLQGFTQKLFNVLNEAGIIKEKMAEEKPVLNADLLLS